jgi:hypothetical protein
VRDVAAPVSRGPGRWQRLLLDALDEYEFVPVNTVVLNNTIEATRIELVAARRAARALVESGRARAIYRSRCTSCYELDPPRFRCCGRVTHVLVLTPARSTALSTLLPMVAPEWISVASGNFGTEATLTPRAGQ